MHTYMHTHIYIFLSHWVIPLPLSQIHLLLPFSSTPSSPRHQHLPLDHCFLSKAVTWQAHSVHANSTRKAGAPKVMTTQL